MGTSYSAEQGSTFKIPALEQGQTDNFAKCAQEMRAWPLFFRDANAKIFRAHDIVSSLGTGDHLVKDKYHNGQLQ